VRLGQMVTLDKVMFGQVSEVRLYKARLSQVMTG
jgi:hypothetical protein